MLAAVPAVPILRRPLLTGVALATGRPARGPVDSDGNNRRARRRGRAMIFGDGRRNRDCHPEFRNGLCVIPDGAKLFLEIVFATCSLRVLDASSNKERIIMADKSQFIHLGAYGRSPRKGAASWSCISGITAEGVRVP